MIVIQAKRWFQKTFGNTYHSVSIIKDGEPLDRVNFKYGYGDSYMQTAHELLAKHGIFDWEKTDTNVPIYRNGELSHHTPQESINKQEAWSKFITDTQDNRQNYVIVCTDVNRKRDL
jgi:hypothetical protein